MTEDVEEILAGLEARLHALQSELDEVDQEQTRDEAPRPPAPPHSSSRSAREEPPDPLEEFGKDLRRLVASYDRVLAQARGHRVPDGILFRDDVALEATADFDGLCDLNTALKHIPGIATADLRAYAGGHAAIDLQLNRATPLVSELRRTLRRSLSVVEAREGRLSIEVGNVAADGPGRRATP